MPGNTIALTAYMIALMQCGLAGKEGSETIKACLGDETGIYETNKKRSTTQSYILWGVDRVETVEKAYTKIGLGNPSDPVMNEFTYVEAGGLKYGVVAMGFYDVADITIRLGQRIHQALSGP